MINWNDIDTKGKESGQIKVKCPACIEQRSNKRDTSLSVNLDKGLANCHYCKEFSIRDYKEIEQNVTYKLPKQEWKNHTNLSDALVSYFKGRGVSQRTLIECKVTEEKFYQPAASKEVNNIVFNYFEGDTIVNKKYRSAKKEFTQSAGTKNIFYGINDVIGKEEIYIVEGEIDKLSLWEIGIENCISVPNGANDNDDVWKNCENYLSDVTKFYIATDNDTKGNEVAEKIAQRLGRWRCERITFKGKDANEDLIESKLVLEESLKNRKKYPVSGSLTVSDFKDGIFDLYDNGLPSTIYPKAHGLERLKEVFSFMYGQVTVITGIPSHGKSTFIEWYLLNCLVEHDMKMSMFSPEHSPYELHQTNFIQKFHGKPFWSSKDGLERIKKSEVEEYIDWANERIYITAPDKQDTPDWDWLLETFKEQIYAYGINVFLIDAFNKVILSGTGSQKEKIDAALTRLTAFAQQNNVAVFLVAHPTKMKKQEGSGEYEMPTLYDVSGSADFRNQTHNGACVYRHFGEDDYTEFTNLKTKFSFQGEIGAKVSYQYHIPTGRYFLRDHQPNLEPLLRVEKQTSFKELTETYENNYPPEWDE
jgi:twinkle protein